MWTPSMSHLETLQLVVGMTLASQLQKLKKIAPKRFKVWFNRAMGANTYVNEFGIEGHLVNPRVTMWVDETI